MNKMGWRKFAVVYDVAGGATPYTGEQAYIQSTAATLGMNILSEVTFDYTLNTSVNTAVNAIKASGARIIYVSSSEQLPATTLWIAAYAAGLVTKDYVWVAVNGELLASKKFWNPDS
ncbi:hypothetical protein HDU87_002778 [Geranomyces variabilis]|uniref:Receptor ligand binding region domain-containing protein n=1 Tax=Geranomyces variabilis TaxID=109894 RepID=A0AAD5TN39_9FUNG|nr:hypothetical protein HDU87_002778 [Geranomyces variabilis]